VNRLRPLLATLVATGAAVLAVGCSSGDAASATTTPATTTPAGGGAATAPASAQATRGVRLVKVRGGLGDALDIVPAPGQPNRLYVVQQSGRIRILDHGRLLPGSFLDISSQVSSGGERGLLGLAFHPGYARNGRFYVDYTNRSGDTRVVQYRRASANRANRGSARTLLAIHQPFANHNGGDLVFGPDGDLYIGMGDGGGAGDPEGNGQDVGTLLGKLLRIDVDRRSGGRLYAIPAGNPFARGGGRPEIYAYGLRNPWRFSFDRTRGDLWIGDVGQNRFEEIDYRPKGRGAGANFGWNAFEGRGRYRGGGSLRVGSTPVAPVAQYPHAQGCSVTGGFVYRGTAVPALRGRYVYADYCSGRVWSLRAGPRPSGVRAETGLGVSLSNVTSFGQGANGELYLLAHQALYRFARR
jgi:glucose/arabinose dehydrogenase